MELFIQESLVTVAPAEVLGTDVLVGVFWLFLNRDVVGDVLPVLVPEIIGIDGGDNQGRDSDAVGSGGRMIS